MQVHLSSRLEPLVDLLLSRPMSVYTSLYRFRAVHLELVSDLTTESFIACLRRFIACRGKPTLIWSDHWTTFVGASRDMKEDLVKFLESQTFPTFWRCLGSSDKSMKFHLCRILCGV